MPVSIGRASIARVCLAVGVAACSGAVGSVARAEEPKIDYADGPAACKEFDKRNERELKEWEKQQPPTPYAYPRDGEVLTAPWGPFFRSIGKHPDLLIATLTPHLGAQYRAENPALVLAFPWQFPIGPAGTCSRKQGTFIVQKYKNHRALLEPGITTGKQGTGVYVRPGYRFMYHPSEWVVGLGGGLGHTFDVAGAKEKFRYSVSPEAVLQFGHCCDAGYFVLAVRYDHYFSGIATDIFGGTLGFTFF